MNQQSASKMLQVTGILMIIGGAFSVIASIILLFGSVLLSSAAAAVAGSAGAAVGGILIVAVIVALVASVAELVAGILGAANYNKPEKANSCFIFGIVNIAIGVLSIILGITSDSFNFMNVISSLALPVLYTIAAFFCKKNAESGMMQ